MDVKLGGDPEGPLSGIRVVDCSTVVSGPLCGQILGDLGADVVKIESPQGDTTRRLGPPFVGGLTPLYTHCNRNKQSITLDLKQVEAVEVARKLAQEADVFLENWRPEVAGRLGLGYEALSAENPGLVYVSINGYGPDGPYADQPAYDMLVQALTGLAPELGTTEEPKLVRNLMADKTSALSAAYATLAALFARERHPEGRGQRLTVPMLDAYAAFSLVDSLNYHTFPPVGELPPDVISPLIYRAWKTRDGHVAAVVIEDRQFHALCRVLDREDLIDDPRCANLITRIQHAGEIFPTMGEEIAKWTTAELLERARKFEAPLARVNDVAGFLADPQAEHNRAVFETEDPEAGTVRLLRNPIRYESTPTSMRRRPPRLGEDTEAVLRQLGYGETEIAALREAGALGA
ncbi:MAG: CoA transferase [Myxococcales bacterium]|nr:CoA transferase [Myxococcales bacterium]